MYYNTCDVCLSCIYTCYKYVICYIILYQESYCLHYTYHIVLYHVFNNSQIWDLCRNTAHNIDIQYRTNSVENND